MSLEVPPLTNGVTIKQEEELSANSDCFIKCSQCQKGCQSFLALKEHMESQHGGDLTPSPASENGVISKCSPLSPNLNLTAGPYACSQCSSTFTTKDQLEKHELLHSPNAQVSCKICNKTFANVYRLQRHMISHDESAVLRKFKCTECDKAFKFKHHLKEHIRIHSGEKPFECGNCGKRFSHSGSYSSHMTSKKCLVMNLKLGRTRTHSTNTLLDKTAQQRIMKRSNISPINNNIATSPNHNSYLPILPKYSEAAAAFIQSSIAANSSMGPFYLTPPALLNPPHQSPYGMPTLGQILDQLQQQRHSPAEHNVESHEEKDLKSYKEIDVDSVDQQCDNDRKSDTSSCGDLIMDEEADNEHEIKKENLEQGKVNGDLEAVKRILETVNASVTKQFLQANMQKVTDLSTNSSPNIYSTNKDFECSTCKKKFENSHQMEDHECDIQSEGLAAKLEEAVTCKSEDYNGNNSSNEEQEFDRCKTEDDCDSITDHISEDGRKVRVRSLISDEQLKVLKDNYALNPRPKREELEKIANIIGFSVRVVQVWFQNTRARDRREGRLIQVPYSPNSSVSRYPLLPPTTSSLSVNQQISKFSNQYMSEQPLDLSTKKNSNNSTESTPANSPPRYIKQEHEEAVNLSRRSHSPSRYIGYINHYQNSNSCTPPHSPTENGTNSRLAQILSQPAPKINLPGMGLVPVDHLLQFGGDLPSLSQLLNNKNVANLSPNSDKQWNDSKDNEDGANSSEDVSNPAKRLKVSQFVLKGLGSPLQGNHEGDSEGQFICDQCDKAFSKQSSLARHRYEHSGQRPHKCDECPKAFKHKHHLTEHKRLHSGEKPFQCTKCLKRFSHSGSYSQHMNHRYSYCKPYRE